MNLKVVRVRRPLTAARMFGEDARKPGDPAILVDESRVCQIDPTSATRGIVFAEVRGFGDERIRVYEPCVVSVPPMCISQSFFSPFSAECPSTCIVYVGRRVWPLRRFWRNARGHRPAYCRETLHSSW
jgi:hypothetical protein